MDIDLIAEIKTYEAEIISLQGQLMQAQQRTQQLGNHVVMRQGIVAYLRLKAGQEAGRQQLQALINPPDPPMVPPAPESST